LCNLLILLATLSGISHLKNRIDIRIIIRYSEGVMKAEKKIKKITVMLPQNLLKRAMQESGEGITPTLKKGLELIAAKGVYKKLLGLKGKIDLKLDLNESRKNRDE